MPEARSLNHMPLWAGSPKPCHCAAPRQQPNLAEAAWEAQGSGDPARGGPRGGDPVLRYRCKVTRGDFIALNQDSGDKGVSGSGCNPG